INLNLTQIAQLTKTGVNGNIIDSNVPSTIGNELGDVANITNQTLPDGRPNPLYGISPSSSPEARAAHSRQSIEAENKVRDAYGMERRATSGGLLGEGSEDDPDL